MVRPRARPHRAQGGFPFAPVLRHRGIAGVAQQIAAVEEDPRVDVPGHAPGVAVEHVGIPDAGEVVVADDALRRRDPRVERQQGADGMELRDPGVAELRHVGRGAADERGQQLLVRRRPGNLLHLDAHAGMGALEVRNELAQHLALAAEPPDDESRAALGARARPEGQEAESASPRCRAIQFAASHPPSKPARSSPRRTAGLARISRQSSPLRWFSSMASRMPWSIPR